VLIRDFVVNKCEDIQGKRLIGDRNAGKFRHKLTKAFLSKGNKFTFFICFLCTVSEGEFYSSTNSFLFEVRKNVRFWSTNRPAKAIYNSNRYGPTFGDSHDLYIADRCKYNTNHSNFGYTYELPNGIAYGSSQAKAFLAGSHTFQCDEYEVYYQK